MDTSTPTPDPIPTATQPQINPYHCICSTLLLVTTHNLSLLPRRAEPALDKAFILPLPPASRRTGETAGRGEDDEGEEREVGEEEEEQEDEGRQAQRSDVADVGYSLLLSTTQD